MLALIGKHHASRKKLNVNTGYCLPSYKIDKIKELLKSKQQVQDFDYSLFSSLCLGFLMYCN